MYYICELFKMFRDMLTSLFISASHCYTFTVCVCVSTLTLLCAEALLCAVILWPLFLFPIVFMQV